MTESLSGRVALAVDDSPEALSLVHDALEQAGMDVLVALEGKQALSIAERMKPDVILLDARMPKLDGFETCKQLKVKPSLSDVPVLFMTGLDDPDSVLKGFESGGVDYLTKPVHPSELIARIQVHLSSVHRAQQAYSALDQGGQHLLAVLPNGQPRWSTPRAHTQLAEAGYEPEPGWLLAQSLQRWIADKPIAGSQFDCALSRLTFTLVEQRIEEWLLKVGPSQVQQGPEWLQTALGTTERESEVLFWIAQGDTNREVAERLSLSPRTINKHLELIFTKLGVDNRTRAASLAIKSLAQGGLIS